MESQSPAASPSKHDWIDREGSCAVGAAEAKIDSQRFSRRLCITERLALGIACVYLERCSIHDVYTSNATGSMNSTCGSIRASLTRG